MSTCALGVSRTRSTVERRERCHMAVLLLQDLNSYLMMCVENGEAARTTMEKFANQ